MSEFTDLDMSLKDGDIRAAQRQANLARQMLSDPSAVAEVLR